MTVVGSQAYVADGLSGLHVIDISNLAHPTSVTSSTRRTETPARYISISASSAELEAAVDLVSDTTPYAIAVGARLALCG